MKDNISNVIEQLELSKKYAKDSGQTELYNKCCERINALRMKYEALK